MLFSLLNMDRASLVELYKVMNDVINILVGALKSENARIRLDTCRVLHIMAVHVPEAACGGHKSRVSRALRDLLDDPKREVRMEAGEARCMWMHIDEKQTLS